MAVTLLLPPPPSPYHAWWTGDVLTAARAARGAASQHRCAQLLLGILSVLHRAEDVLFSSNPKQAASDGLWRGPGDVPGAVGVGVNHSKAPSPHSSRECLPEPPGQRKQEKDSAPALL